MTESASIKKVLVAEDLEFIAAGIEKALNELPAQVVHARYCDDAWLKLKRAQLDQEPFDLLITDLSFAPDHRNVELKNGEELIQTLLQDQIPCKIIVFSIEDRPMKVRSLFDRYQIDAYVLKGRYDHLEISKAIRALCLGETYISEEISKKINSKKSIAQVEEIDLQIIRLLCEGKTQDEISHFMHQKDIRPNSISTIEKRLKNLKEDFSAKTNIELVLIFKEMGLV